MKFQAYCPDCNKIVSAWTILDDGKLKTGTRNGLECEGDASYTEG